MNINDYIKELSSKDKKTLSQKALKLTEEVGEVARLMARIYGEQSFKRKEDEVKKQIMIDTGIDPEIVEVLKGESPEVIKGLLEIW